jgi:hypothetical protein
MLLKRNIGLQHWRGYWRLYIAEPDVTRVKKRASFLPGLGLKKMDLPTAPFFL